MEYEEREKLLLRILSSRQVILINKEFYVVQEPTIQQKLEADLLYEELAYELSFEDWISKKDTLNILTRMGIWSSELDDRYKLAEKNINDLKVSLYKNHLNSVKVQQLKKSLSREQKVLEQLYHKRSLLDYVTIESYIAALKTQYLIALSILDDNGDHVYTKDSFWYNDPQILLKCLKTLNDTKPSTEILRELAHTEPWRGFWNVGKERVFDKGIVDWTYVQRTLALYSKMYDNAYNHPECPSEDVINDDDMFDGWVLVQDEKRKQQVADSNMDNLVKGKAKDAGELFIPVETEKDASRIMGMNDLDTRIKLAQRTKQLKQQGKVDEGKFRDQQIEFHNIAQRAIMDRAKRR